MGEVAEELRHAAYELQPLPEELCALLGAPELTGLRLRAEAGVAGSVVIPGLPLRAREDVRGVRAWRAARQRGEEASVFVPQ
jgi:hypothetical protein